MSHASDWTCPPLQFSAKARRTQEAPISALMAAAIGNAELISFAAGLVDERTLPVEECAAIAQRIFADRGRGPKALQYDTTLGLRPLRQELLKHLEKLEGKPGGAMGLSAEQIIVTTGSQQALYLMADVLLDEGDIVIAGNPSYFVFTGTLASLGARVLSVPMDEQGMDVERIGTLLAKLEQEGQLERVKFIYCTSYFDNPTGLTLSGERRQRLLEIVRGFGRRQRILIVEDAAYRELNYEAGTGLASIKSMDAENRYTVLTQTFSKPFAPGLKLGYTAMPPDLLDAVLHQKGNHDFGSSNLCQQIALEALASGIYQEHLEVLRRAYRRKRDVMLEALERYMPEGVKWTRPAGGLYVWLTLPEAVNTSRQNGIFQACVDKGVLYVPGEYCFQPDENGTIPRHHLRLSFGQVALEKIEEGIARLGQVVRGALAECKMQNAKCKMQNARSEVVKGESA